MARIGKNIPVLRQDLNIYVDPVDGNDGASGTSSAPIKSLRELMERIPLLSEGVTVTLMPGEHELFDWWANKSTGGMHLGTLGSTMVVQGSYDETIYTVDSATGLDITITPDPGWTTDEHTGKSFHYGPALRSSAGIISNTSNTLKVLYPNTDVGGTWALPAVDSTIEIRDITSKIVPSPEHGNFFANKLFLFGNITFKDVSFDGGGIGGGPAASRGGDKLTFIGCSFKNYTGVGLWADSKGSLLGCVFENIDDAGAEHGAGSFTQYNHCLFLQCATGIRASFGGVATMGAFSLIGGVDIANELINVKTYSRLNDEYVQIYLDNVRDYVKLQRGSSYIKVNSALIGVVGNESVTRNVVRAENGGNFIDLLDTANATVSGITSYLNLDGVDVSLTDYTASGYFVTDTRGNRVID